ncbi:MAG: L-lactate dehydrogenase, partial [Clostridia bacterium]|nr:L-lactate dehydrogenase [Clostridia bacterium]
LDTARLRFLLGRYFKVDPRNVHAYVIGEHGDSGFVPWSQAMISVKPVADILSESLGQFDWAALKDISCQVKNSAQQIIQAKRATYYGIGMVLARITRAILEDENSVLTLSCALLGSLYAGMPCILNRQGVRELLRLSLLPGEQKQLESSLAVLEEAYAYL